MSGAASASGELSSMFGGAPVPAQMQMPAARPDKKRKKEKQCRHRVYSSSSSYSSRSRSPQAAPAAPAAPAVPVRTPVFFRRAMLPAGTSNYGMMSPPVLKEALHVMRPEECPGIKTKCCTQVAGTSQGQSLIKYSKSPNFAGECILCFCC